MSLGAWGAVALGGPPDGPGSGPRPAAPVPPVKYLEAGARLFNGGQYDTAAKYINAAQAYRDQLSPSEQTVLDAYLRELAKTPADAQPAAAPAADAAPATDPAPAMTPADPPAAMTPAQAQAPAPGGDSRQQAKWLLQSARDQVRAGDYDGALAKVARANALNVKWGLFDDTPAKVGEAIAKARPRDVAVAAAADARKDKNEAKAKLKEAHAALSAKQFERAEAIAMDVKSWNLSYGLFEDNPDKVAAAARALRRRDSLRGESPRQQPSQGVYDVLVQEARQLAAAGKPDEAEAKAKKAQRMNVVPAVTADRAEAVLHDLAMARARQSSAPAKGDSAVAVAGAEGLAAEREGNALLAQGDDKAAAAKYAQADGQPATAVALAPPDGTAAAPAADPLGADPESHGAKLLEEARALYNGGNYAAAKQTAEEAKAGGFGLDQQANEVLTQVALAEQGAALAMYEDALDAVRKGDVAAAKMKLNEVAAMGDNLDDGLRQKVQSLLDKLPKDPAGKATVGDRMAAADPDALAAQKLNAEVGTKIAEARRLQETDPEKALALYDQTLKGVKAAGLPESLARTMTRRLEVAIELAKKDKLAFDAKMKDKAFRTEIELKRLRILEADNAKKARMKELMDKATGALAEGKYTEAEAFARRAMEVDPNEVAATIVAYKARAEKRFKQDVETRRDKEDGANTAFQQVDVASIADTEVQLNGIKYAKNFADMTRDRLRMNAKLEPKKDPQTAAIQSQLEKQVTLNFDKLPLADAIRFLQNYTGLNIVLDTKALTDENITSASPVDLHVTNLRLKSALRLILRPLGLTYKAEDEVLLITNPQSSMTSTYAKTYYVGDLVMPPGNKAADAPFGIAGMYQSPSSGRNPNEGSPQAMQMGNGISSMAPHPNGAEGTVGRATKGDRPQIDLAPIVQLISTSIAPGTWRVFDGTGGPGQDTSAAYGLGAGFGPGGGGGDAGGVNDAAPIGSITPFFLSISLIIKHTAEIHDQVADLLRQLRRLSDNFFEQIGVTFDFSIPSKAIGRKSTLAVANPAATLFVPPGVTGATSGSGGGGNLGGAGGGLGGGGTGGGAGGAGGTGGGTGAGAGTTGGGGTTGGAIGGGGGTTTGGGGGGGGGGGQNPSYIVNPIRDYSYGNRGVTTVGLQAPGGIGNFTPDLQIPFIQNSASLIAPSNATGGTSAGGSFGLAFLSDLELYLFLQASQGDTRLNILQAPKVTTFNGAAATIINNETINYVAELLPIVGPGSVSFFPQVAQFPNGVQLQVTPVVSADRRYVRMTLAPNFTALEGFDTISVPAAVGGSGLGGGSAAINGTIQLPRFTITAIQTTVTVPDGGTVLLGGVKRLNEERREFGVPVLSKIPALNRLFRNVGIGRVTSSLMMMVTPRIIILEEEEERLGVPTIAL